MRRRAQLQDVLPTLLGLCGLPIPPGVRGRDLLTDGPEPEAVYGTYGTAGVRHVWQPLHAVCTDDRACIAHPNGGFEDLYDLRRDPDERHNLAADTATATVRVALRQRLERWLLEHGGPDVLDSTGRLSRQPYDDVLAEAEPLASTPLGMRPH